MTKVGSAVLALVVAFSAAGCVFGGAGGQAGYTGCELRQGNGPRDQGVDPPGIPLDGIAGLTPPQAFAAAAQQGHVVVFRLDGMACVCLPPAGYGPVTEGWWGSNGVLWLDLQDVQPQGARMQNNTGC